MKSIHLSFPIPISIPIPIPIPNTLTPPTPKFHPPKHKMVPLRCRIPPVLGTNSEGLTVKEEETSSSEEIEPIPEGLRRGMMPRHVAIIMDGNGRWAEQQGWLASRGHEAGSRSLMEIIRLSGSWGIKVLTVFAFSSDNWTRPEVEVKFLMSLFERLLKSEMEKFVRQGIRVSIIGDSLKLTPSLQRLISEVEEKTNNNPKLHLLVAVSYSGKYDVLKACKSIASKVKDGEIDPDDIDESLIEQELETNCSEFPSPDLLIRTSGELRISNFLLWQLAYTELFFAPELWPDFGKEGFVQALTSYQQRQRRFGQRHS
ncbi:Undecaprenyl pyrophosphate synthetase family protein [Euphorbia peplus]|nr:Undecaprenyl pyrophosphate synthetase family protein [Euphorbia peplus]